MPEQGTYTLARAKAVLRAVGVTINKRHGEYRVNLLGGREATAYYTDDIQDAVETGLRMADQRPSP